MMPFDDSGLKGFCEISPARAVSQGALLQLAAPAAADC